MAEIARNFGERRMCRIEVDMLSIDTVIYCLEHETLQMALSPLETVVSVCAGSIPVSLLRNTG